MDRVNKSLSSRLRGTVHPRSFFELVIVGFSLVSLPLMISLITGASYVNELTEQSQTAVTRAVEATKTSRYLLELTRTMERDIRQFLVLEDDQLYRRYTDRHISYVEASKQLQERLLDKRLRDQLNSLNTLEGALFERLNNSVANNTVNQLEPMEFVALTDLARELLRDSDKLIDSELELMNTLAQEAKNSIIWVLIAVLPVVIIFIIVFIIMLSRPIRQLDQGIRDLGDGKFEKDILVSGPRDIQYLGERLNWLRTRLKYLEEKKTKFLHYVSHELKTPLAAIRESSELLSEGVTGPLNEGQKEVCHILQKNTVSLQKMIEKLLSFNLPGKNQGKIEQIFIPHIIDTVVADHKPVFMTKSISLSLNCDNVVLEGDEEQIRVIVDNLLSNAVKFTPENGNVSLSVKQKEQNIIMDVEDSGPGIDAEDTERVFDAFYRGKADGSGTIQGSGLGLSIVQEFVIAHQGRIELLPPKEHGGAHFRITMPTNLAERELKWAV